MRVEANHGISQNLNQLNQRQNLYFLLSIVFLLPLPLGADVAWAWSLFELAIFALTLKLLFERKNERYLGVKDYFSAILLWFIFLFVGILQILALPDFIVALLSPTSFEIYQSVDTTFSYISVDTGLSAISLVKSISLFCLFLSILIIVRTVDSLKMLLTIMLASGFFQAFYASLEWLMDLEESLIFSRPIRGSSAGSFVDSEHLSNFLILSIIAGFGLLINSLQEYRQNKLSDINNRFEACISYLLENKRILGASLSFIFIVTIAVGTPLSSAAIGISLAVVGSLSLLLIKSRSTGFTALLIGIFILDLVLVSAHFGMERVKKRLAQTEHEESSISHVVSDAYPILADFPLLGSGGGTFETTFPSYQKSFSAELHSSIKNDYLQFLVEYGLIGGFIIFALFIYCIYKATHAMYGRRSAVFKGASFACLSAFLAVGIHMSQDHPLQNYTNACYFVIFIALSLICNIIKADSQKHSLK